MARYAHTAVKHLPPRLQASTCCAPIRDRTIYRGPRQIQWTRLGVTPQRPAIERFHHVLPVQDRYDMPKKLDVGLVHTGSDRAQKGVSAPDGCHVREIRKRLNLQ